MLKIQKHFWDLKWTKFSKLELELATYWPGDSMKNDKG